MSDGASDPKGQPDPLIDAIVAAMMAHAAPKGTVEYPHVAAAFIKLLAEMLGPQPTKVQQAMMKEFQENLRTAVLLAALRCDVGAAPSPEKPQ